MNIITLKDLSESQISLLKEFKELGANKEQLKEYALGLYNNIEISKIQNINLSSEQMREIRLGEESGLLTQIYEDYDADKMKEIRYGLECKRQDQRNIQKYLDFDTDQLKCINDAYNDGLTEEQIDWFANKNYTENIMRQLKNLIRSNKIKNEQEIPTNPKLSEKENQERLNQMGKKDKKNDNDIEKQMQTIQNTEEALDEIEESVNASAFLFDDEDSDFIVKDEGTDGNDLLS